MSNAAEFLLGSQNADGGWGYRVGGMSYVEPTAAVLLAFQASAEGDERGAQSSSRALGFLLSVQRQDGGWGVAPVDGESGWMTAWAVWALAKSPSASSAVARGTAWLRTAEGFRVTDPGTLQELRGIRQADSSLRGWPWLIGDACWVHPTALSIIALVNAGSAGDSRVQAGVQFLLDRAIDSGGWNVGEPATLGKALPATVQDSCIALLALSEAGLDPKDPKVTRGLDFLAGRHSSSPSELAWSAYALRRWNVAHDDILARLNALEDAKGGWQGNPFVTAMALLARA